MNNTNKICCGLIDRLALRNSLSTDEYCFLINNQSEATTEYAASKAVLLRKKFYGNDVYIRGLIEISNYCKCNCLYCGIRRSNTSCERYRLSSSEILSCCKTGYEIGFRTFVLQGGEDSYFSDSFVCSLISTIKNEFPDCAVTLSLGERSRESYSAFFNAGADRYLLRHETACRAHYAKLHPKEQSFDNRMRCLKDLKDIGFQVGCGFMVGSPHQTNQMIAEDLKFIEEFQPEMCGIGPFIPHRSTPFSDFEAGSIEKTLFLLSIIRLIHPNILLPSTTALGTVHPCGREKGILSGANVIMPNLSPESSRKKYELYDNKICTGSEAAENLNLLKERIKSIGYNIVTARGDFKYIKNNI